MLGRGRAGGAQWRSICDRAVSLHRDEGGKPNGEIIADVMLLYASTAGYLDSKCYSGMVSAEAFFFVVNELVCWFEVFAVLGQLGIWKCVISSSQAGVALVVQRAIWYL